MTQLDRIQLDAFERFLTIAAWRERELGENRYKSMAEASLVVYGDKVCEGNKHLDDAGYVAQPDMEER